MWTVGMWHIHNNNVPPHTALSNRVLGKTFNPCPFTNPYLPDLSPPKLLLSKLKMTLKDEDFKQSWTLSRM